MSSTQGTDAHPHGSLQHEDVAHETSDISVRGIIWFVVTLAVIVAVIQVAIVGLFKVFDRIETRNDPFVTPLAAPEAFPPSMSEPRLQTTPWLDLKEFRTAEDEYLDSYGWVDQKSGVAHLPIEKAKELLLQRGLPTRAGQPDPSEGTDAFAYGESSGGRAIPAGGPDLSSPAPAQTTPATTTPATPKTGGRE